MAAHERHMVVTGASTGLGLTIAREAKRRGWKVLGTVRREQDRERLGEEGIDTEICDITHEDSVRGLGAAVEAWSDGSLAALVNNAGTAHPAPVEEIDLQDLRDQFEVNVVGHIAVTQALLPALRRGGGTVVMISSDNAVITAPLLGAYCASKRALEAFAEALDLETSEQGVRTLIVRPGSYESDIWETSLGRAGKYRTEASRYRDLADRVQRHAATPGRRRDPRELAVRTLDLVERSRAAFRTTVPRNIEATAATLLPWSAYKAAVRRALR
ncbi:MAG: SDR family NAD(P)-dependent oxidoreductase [Acidimicrobiia bacterium]|nr:SDR family NAD(P)-dependent oxidoreductase [Acidimicrobiia bacterium]